MYGIIMHHYCDYDFLTFGQADHFKQPQEEKRFVFVNAGVAERKHLD